MENQFFSISWFLENKWQKYIVVTPLPLDGRLSPTQKTPGNPGSAPYFLYQNSLQECSSKIKVLLHIIMYICTTNGILYVSVGGC